MNRPSRRTQRFVRALLAGMPSTVGIGCLRAGTASIALEEAQRLVSEGVLSHRDGVYTATDTARGWLRRAMVEADGFAAQHRVMDKSETRNLAESPLARLATTMGGEAAAFLERHQVEAGERVCRLAARARMMPRTTTSYSVAHVANGGPGRAAEVSDMASEARQRLSDLWQALPRDCAEVVFDVCALEKGLQQVELERGWPRRSAKLVLRIGLEQLALKWGLSAQATGLERGRSRGWMAGERPAMFAEPG